MMAKFVSTLQAVITDIFMVVIQVGYYVCRPLLDVNGGKWANFLTFTLPFELQPLVDA